MKFKLNLTKRHWVYEVDTFMSSSELGQVDIYPKKKFLFLSNALAYKKSLEKRMFSLRQYLAYKALSCEGEESFEQAYKRLKGEGEVHE